MRSPRNYTIFPRTSRFHSALRLIINRQQLSQIRNDTYVISSQCWVITWGFIDFLAAPGYLLPTAMPVQASSTVQATTPFGDYLSHAFTRRPRSEEHTSELQSLMRLSYAVLCLKNNTNETHSPT